MRQQDRRKLTERHGKRIYFLCLLLYSQNQTLCHDLLLVTSRFVVQDQTSQCDMGFTEVVVLGDSNRLYK